MLKITKNQGSIQVTADKSGFYPFDGTITFPTNSLFTATSANTDMITFKSTSNGDVQFVGNYKDITISGRSYDTKQKFLTAFSNLANQGSVDAYTKAETDTKLDAKQDKLTAVSGITIAEDEIAGTSTIATAVSLTDNGEGAYQVGDSIEIGGQSSVRIGLNTGNVLQGQNSIVIGDHAVTNAEKCIAIGNSTNTSFYSTHCTVIGDDASAAKSYCTVIGTDARSNSYNGVAVGYNAYIDSKGGYGVAVGSNSTARGENSVAIGKFSNATNDNPLFINAGYKTVDGKKQPLTVLQSDSTGKLSILKGDGTDERIVIQDEIEALKNAGGSGGSANPLVNVKGTGSATIAEGVTSGVAIGSGASVNRPSGVAIGYQSEAKGSNGVAIGSGARYLGASGIAIGGNTSSMSSKAIAIGDFANATAKNAVAIGPDANASKEMPLVIKAGDNANNSALPMIQGDSTGKISVLLGDGTASTMCIQDEIAALKAEIAALKGGASTGA